MNLKKHCVISLLLILSFSAFAENEKIDSNDTKISFFSGLFDISHNDQNSTLFGFQHQNENLQRDTFIGKLSPITGAMITADNATYFYTGVQAEYNIGPLNFTPSFTPGYYDSGDGKDLGNILEFKSEVQLSMKLSKNSQFGLSYFHISNGNLGDKNPGANSYMFNFFRNF